MADNTLGRGDQHAGNGAGVGKLAQPLTTSTYDARDKGAPHSTIQATRETPAAPPGRGLHDKSILGG